MVMLIPNSLVQIQIDHVVELRIPLTEYLIQFSQRQIS